MVKKSYSSFNEGKANSAFAKRLREEFLTDSVKVQQLADCLGCSTQAINQYKQGTSFPKMENLIKIAEFYNCSLDYLIGLSDVKSPDAEIQSVCEYTGLSQNAVKTLNSCTKSSLGSTHTNYSNVISILLEFANTGIFEQLSNFFYSDYITFIYPDDVPIVRRAIASQDKEWQQEVVSAAVNETKMTEIAYIHDSSNELSQMSLELDNRFKSAVFLNAINDTLRQIRTIIGMSEEAWLEKRRNEDKTEV